jgi:ATP-dependent DNA helicase DinG
MATIVALDLETTGLDPNRDEIIEIGAVRIKDGLIEDEWSTLVNPGRSIPKEITQLTNINNQMVSGAPSIGGVVDELIAFIGNETIVGHNVGFDLAFLRNQGVAENNVAADTYELASVLLPTSSRYNLGALCREHGVILKDAHRALDDARATGELFFILMEKAAQLPLNLLAMFVRLSEPFDWGAFWPFQQLLKEQRYKPMAGNLFDFNFGPLFESENNYLLPPLEPIEDPTPLNIEEVASILQYGGPFSQYFPNYEYRPEQQHMLEAVTNALSYSQHLLVEAGTGTGKSLAYLIPASLFAIQNNTRVVISTNTINLQDQLIKKDIPDLRESLDIDLRAIVLKGRGNYLCPRRLEMMSKSRPPQNTAEMRVFAKVMVWLHEYGKGDRAEINLNGHFEQAVWSRLSAEFEGCNFDDCPRILNNSSCPYYQAHQAAQSAHILIVNHALLLADVATGNRVLPPYDYVIADEAHHMEDASTNSLSFRVSESDIRTYLRELGGKRGGILQRVMNACVPLISPQQYGVIEKIISRSTDLAFRLEHDFRNLFIAIDEFLIDLREGKSYSPYAQQVRIIPATRTLPGWTEVEIIWDQTHETLTLLDNLLQQLHKEVGNLRQQFREELEEPATSLGYIMTSLGEVHTRLGSILMEPDYDFIYWVATNPRSNNLISLNMAPLHVGPLMEEYIWHKKEAVIMTSATLTANGEFDYLAQPSLC